MTAPTDPQFYTDLAARFTAFGKPEDFLWIWSSETGLDPTLSGASRTISTMMHDGVVPSLMTQAEWDSLPTLSAKDQLPFIQRYYQVIHDKYLFRRFQDTFEVYLANAAPGLLRPDGKYSALTVMYGNPQTPANAVWAANWPMDNYPVAPQQAAARKAAMDLTLGKTLVSEGLLKGWISLSDLKNFGLRQGNSAIANDAIKRYKDANAALQTIAFDPSDGSAGGYAPDFSKSFSDASASPDTRVAPQPSILQALTLKETVVLGVGIWLFWRYIIR